MPVRIDRKSSILIAVWAFALWQSSCACRICADDAVVSTLPPKEFLRTVREKVFPESEYWVGIEGDVSRQEQGKDSRIDLKMNIQASSLKRQITLNTDKGKTVLEWTKAGGVPIVDGRDKAGIALGVMGFSSEDVGLTFLHWNILEEKPGVSPHPQQECRVFLLEHPTRGDRAIVTIDVTRCRPVKAQWLKKGGGKPVRTVRYSAWKDVYITEEFATYNQLSSNVRFSLPLVILTEGVGWRSSVGFDPRTMKAGLGKWDKRKASQRKYEVLTPTQLLEKLRPKKGK